MTQWIAGNGVRNTAQFGGADVDFRLQELQVKDSTDTVLQQFDYVGNGGAGYDAAGNLKGFADNTNYGTSPSPLANSWAYQYDGLGRLTRATLNGGAPVDFGYDGLGNMTNYGTLTFTPNSAKPHHILQSSVPGAGQPYQYDANGGLSFRPDTDSSGPDTARTEVTYDLDGRVSTVTTADGHVVRSLYNYRGERVARIADVNTGSFAMTFFFGRWFDFRVGGSVTRHIYLGDRLIADSQTGPPYEMAALPESERTILLARAMSEAVATRPGLYPVVALSGMAAVAVGGSLLVLCMGLAFAPGRVRLAYLGKVRRGRVAVVIVLFAVALSPLPLARPAWAGGGGGGGGGSPPPTYPVYFIHSDHLGSTMMLTCYLAAPCTNGTIVGYYRYDAYGQPREYDGSGSPLVPPGTAVDGVYAPERLYTGQTWDWQAQLYDYGARFYDPKIANFLTEDPAHQGVNPYAYVGWNPVRFTDPTGMNLWGTAVGFTSLGYNGFDSGKWAGLAAIHDIGAAIGGGEAAGIAAVNATVWGGGWSGGTLSGALGTVLGAATGFDQKLSLGSTGVSIGGVEAQQSQIGTFLGNLMAAPATALAFPFFYLAAAISGLVTGQTTLPPAQFSYEGTTLSFFGGNPLGYLTIGHAIFGPTRDYVSVQTSGAVPWQSATTMSHEFGHVGQFNALGLAFLGIYAAQFPAGIGAAALTQNPNQVVQFNILENFFLGGAPGTYQLPN